MLKKLYPNLNVVILCVALGLVSATASAGTNAQTPDAPGTQAFMQALSRAGAHFEANAGQLPPSADFAFRSQDYRLELMPAGIELKPRGEEILLGEPMQILFAGADHDSAGYGVNRLPFQIMHRVSQDGVRSAMREVHAYEEVVYQDVYAGIDVRYHINQGRLEYDFLVEPGSDPSQIHLAVRGAEEAVLDERSNLLLTYPVAHVVHHRPRVYQIIEGARSEVESQYVILDDRTVEINVGTYDASAPLVIDPLLSIYLEDSVD